MKIFRDLEKIPEKYKKAVVTLGNFDGLHLGHQAIITKARDIAATTKSPLALMSFEPHPHEFFSKERTKSEHRIYNLYSKLSAIESLGVDCVFLLRFNADLANLSAHDFIKTILIDKLDSKYIITGDNFCFGKNRQGDKDLLQKESQRLGFSYTACAPVMNNESAISSSKIRQLIKRGDIAEASKLLGRPYHISGHVKHGEGRGTKIGFPTANIGVDRLLIPNYGVYAVEVRIAGNNEIYNGVANLGVKPTFGVHTPLLEVHLFDTEQNLYGKRLCVEFIETIRPEQKFTALEELISQIKNDCKIAKDILAKKQT